MKKVKIISKGDGQNTEIYIEDILVTCVSKIEILPITADCTVSIILTMDNVALDIESDNLEIRN